MPSVLPLACGAAIRISDCDATILPSRRRLRVVASGACLIRVTYGGVVTSSTTSTGRSSCPSPPDNPYRGALHSSWMSWPPSNRDGTPSDGGDAAA
jgi:hypothetical protein